MDGELSVCLDQQLARTAATSHCCTCNRGHPCHWLCMVIGMATRKVTIALDEEQLDRIRALVEAGSAPSHIPGSLPPAWGRHWDTRRITRPVGVRSHFRRRLILDADHSDSSDVERGPNGSSASATSAAKSSTE